MSEPTYPSAEELMQDLGPELMDFMHSMMTPDPDPDPSDGYHTSLTPHDEERRFHSGGLVATIAFHLGIH